VRRVRRAQRGLPLLQDPLGAHHRPQPAAAQAGGGGRHGGLRAASLRGTARTGQRGGRGGGGGSGGSGGAAAAANADASDDDDDDSNDGEPQLMPRAGERFFFRYSLSPKARDARPDVPQGWGEQQLLFVFRVPDSGGPLEPWVVVGPSVRLQQAGKSGRGVYAWRKGGFTVGQLVGVYVGFVVGACTDPRVAVWRGECPERQHPFDALLDIGGSTVSGKHSPFDGPPGLGTRLGDGREVFPASEVGWPGMFAHLMNDARGLPGAAVNVCVTDPDGVVQAVRRIPRFNERKPLATNACSELFWSYGEGFWEWPQAAGAEPWV
jgi:hypothetical protein